MTVDLRSGPPGSPWVGCASSLRSGCCCWRRPPGPRSPTSSPRRSFPHGEGWTGFTDLDFLLGAFLKLVLATALGAVIGFHPRRIRTADTLEEIEAPKVSIVYAVIGSLIGILVVKYGLVMGFVLFGIGGLIRFRTVMRSAQLTGQVIFVTLIGLTCGLDLPHVAVLATALRLHPHLPPGGPDHLPGRRAWPAPGPFLRSRQCLSGRPHRAPLPGAQRDEEAGQVAASASSSAVPAATLASTSRGFSTRISTHRSGGRWIGRWIRGWVDDFLLFFELSPHLVPRISG